MKGFRIIIIVLGGLAVLTAAALVYLRVTKKTTDTNTNTPVNNAVVNTANLNANTVIANTNIPPVNTNTNAAPANTNSGTNTNSSGTAEANLKNLARSFAERFGTYSNHGDFENIENLLPYMTERMKAWAQGYLESQRAKTVDQTVYYGMTTQSLSAKEVHYDTANGQAEYLVSTQRKESIGTTSNARFFYQDIQIKFLKEQSIWKIDEAWWQ